MTDRLLFVDDEPNVLAAFERQLRHRFDLDTAIDGPTGLDKMRDKDYAVVVADMRMPDMDGIHFLKKAQVLAPDTVRVMLTGNSDQETAVQAVNDGQVYRFLNKPCSPDMLSLTLENAIQQFRYARNEKDLLEKTLIGGVQVLSEILSLSLPDLYGKTEKLRKLARLYINIYGKETIIGDWEIQTAAMLSKIGYITVPEDLTTKVKKGEELSLLEQSTIQNIPLVGFDLLTKIPRLESVANIVKYQGKCFDGSGVPEDAVSGEAIPVEARILKILNDLIEYEEDTGSRVKAFELMKSKEGTYDPEILSGFEEIFALCPENKNTSKRTLMLDFDEIQIGDVLKNGLHTKEGTTIVRPKTEVTLILSRRLASFMDLYNFKTPIAVER